LPESKGAAPKGDAGRASKVERVGLNALVNNPALAGACAFGGYLMPSSSEKPIRLLQMRPFTRYFNSSFTSAKALTANSKSSREWAAETCVRTRAVPCGTTG
jgi:hypothetical protein